MASGVFISYRRSDALADARQLREEFARRIGRSNVFFDLDSLVPGTTWNAELSRALGNSKLFICVIGPTWARSFKDRNPGNDIVLQEVTAALSMRPKIRLIPVLVGGARLEEVLDVPSAVNEIKTIQSHKISYEHYDADILKLMASASEDLPLLRAGPAVDEVFSLLDTALIAVAAGLSDQRSRFIFSAKADFNTIDARSLVRDAWTLCRSASAKAADGINRMPGWSKPLTSSEIAAIELVVNVVSRASGTLPDSEDKLERDFSEIIRKHFRVSRYVAYMPNGALAGGLAGSLFPLVGNVLGAIAGGLAAGRAALAEQRAECKQELISDIGGRYERLIRRARSEATLSAARSVARLLVVGTKDQ